jgi:hypothetical protein
LQRNVSFSNDSLDRSNVYEISPRHLNLPSFSYPTTKAFEWSFWVGTKGGHTCITYVAKSKTELHGDASHTLRSRRAKCVEFSQLS